MKKKSNGIGLIELLLLVAIAAILAGTTIPALKQHNKRSQYREISDISSTITGAIEKCLGLKKKSSACDNIEKIIPFGYSKSQISVNSLIDSVELIEKKGSYILTITPPESNQIYPFINDNLTYIRIANITDRNGRPIIESWETDVKSGCMLAGYC